MCILFYTGGILLYFFTSSSFVALLPLSYCLSLFLFVPLLPFFSLNFAFSLSFSLFSQNYVQQRGDGSSCSGVASTAVRQIRKPEGSSSRNTTPRMVKKREYYSPSEEPRRSIEESCLGRKLDHYSLDPPPIFSTCVQCDCIQQRQLWAFSM